MFVNQISLFLHESQEDLRRGFVDTAEMPAIWFVHRPQSSHLNMGRRKVLETQEAWYPSDIGKAFPFPFYDPAGETDPKKILFK